VLVKGADYRVDQVVGADIINGCGGKVLVAELLPGYSHHRHTARLVR
jgi:D-beta-D-heptose 7-phosphate kinase/D-beta-D-heptose 1-phosphate adenosyltransferase